MIQIKFKGDLSLIIIIILVLPLSGCIETTNDGEDFVFTLLDGTERHLSDYRGKVVILDMWATWCTPCQLQMIELKKVYENYSRNDLEILSIDIEQSESASLIQSFIEEFKNQLGIELNWIFGMDNGSIWRKYMTGQGAIPTLYIFDQKGNVTFTHEGVSVFSEIPPGWPDDIVKLKPKIDELLI